MTLERQTSKPEIAAQKRVIKLPPAIGDWTTYKPPKILVKKVKTGLYGFDRLSRSELDLVLLIHYRFIQQLLKHLKIDLAMAVELFSVQVEQTTYLNFLRTISGPVLQSKITVPGQHDPVSLFFALPLANSIINSALGSRDLEPINRSLTEAENIAFSTALTEYLPDYTAAFEKIFENPGFSVISSPDVTIDSSINTSSTFVCFSAEAALGDNPSGKIIIGYLGSTLKTLLAKYERKIEQKPLNFSALPSSLLSHITIPLSIVLGNTSLTTTEINQLETGDVVTLDAPINSAIPVSLGNILKLICQPGIKDKKIAGRIIFSKETGRAEISPPLLAVEEEIKEGPKPEQTAAKKAPAAPSKEKEEEFEEKFPEEEEEEFPEDEDLFDELEDSEFEEDEEDKL